MHNGDFEFRQTEPRIQSRNARIAPILDLPEENIGKNRLIQLQLVCLDSRQIVNQHHAAAEHRELKQPGFVEFINFERLVGSAEIRGFRLDLIDSGARTERLVVHADILVDIAESVSPDPIHRRGKRSADSVDREVRGGGAQCKSPCQYCESLFQHTISPCFQSSGLFRETVLLSLFHGRDGFSLRPASFFLINMCSNQVSSRNRSPIAHSRRNYGFRRL